MATTEAFRICLLPLNHALPPSELSKRSNDYESALRRLLTPLRLGRRLEFMSVNTAVGLWQVAMITSSGQTPMQHEVPLLEYLDPELHREATSAGNLVFQTFNKLGQLAAQNSFTPIEFENFCVEHFGRLEGAQISPLLRVAIRTGEPIQMSTPAGEYSLFSMGATPRLVTDEKTTLLRFKVLDICLKSATIKPHKQAARVLGIRTRRVHLAFELGLTCKSAVGRKLFKALQHEAYISYAMHRVCKLSGEFHCLLMPIPRPPIDSETLLLSVAKDLDSGARHPHL
jgi:hypothetical protein